MDADNSQKIQTSWYSNSTYNSTTPTWWSLGYLLAADITILVGLVVVFLFHLGKPFCKMVNGEISSEFCGDMNNIEQQTRASTKEMKLLTRQSSIQVQLLLYTCLKSGRGRLKYIHVYIHTYLHAYYYIYIYYYILWPLLCNITAKNLVLPAPVGPPSSYELKTW